MPDAAPAAALTATASSPVRDDIVSRLGLHSAETVITGLDRPNVFVEALPHRHRSWRLGQRSSRPNADG